MNVFDTARVDLARHEATLSRPSRRNKHGRRWPDDVPRRYLPENRAAKKRRREARKRRRQRDR